MPNNNQTTSSTPRKLGRRSSLRDQYLMARRDVMRARNLYNAAQREKRYTENIANDLEIRLFRRGTGIGK